MAGLAAARELTVARRRAGSRFDLALATAADDADARALLRTSPFDGAIRITLEREPSALAAGSIEGDSHQLIVARERASGDLVAVGARSTRTVTVNGEPCRIGHLGTLRIVPRFRRHRDLLDAGFAFCRRLHDLDPVPFYAASVVSDNTRAMRLLGAMPYASAPAFKPLGPLTTLILRAKSAAKAPRPAGFEWRRGTEAMLPDIAACLQRHARRFQLAPWWTADDLRSPRRTRGLASDHFVVACKAGRVVGCAALWDQRAFKQAVVHGYSPAIARWRRAINIAAPLTGTPILPDAGRRLESAFVSHLAVDDDRTEVYAGLIGEIARMAPADLDALVIGLSPAAPATASLARQFRPRRYESTILLAAWADGDAPRRRVDARPLQPEVAIL
ncbi:MAG TPA: hypothetical protein VFO19_18750 [Vicinamibacterales bacterium]|nr:hypothetical protein [Vicinamibacterales bacterium]